jgi:hypothetical protein
VRVPEVESEECLCEKGKETAEHVLLHCDNTPQRAWSRGAQFRKLASEPAAVGQIARQLIQCGKARLVQASEQASLQWVEHLIVSTITNKQRGALERSKGRVSRVFVYKRFP